MLTPLLTSVLVTLLVVVLSIATTRNRDSRW